MTIYVYAETGCHFEICLCVLCVQYAASGRELFRGQMYFLHHSCTFVMHNALFLKKVHRFYSSIHAVCRCSMYLVYFFPHSISYNIFLMEMGYKKSTLNTSGLLKSSSDAGFDTCTFYVLRVLNALFYFPLVYKKACALLQAQTRISCFSVLFVQFCFHCLNAGQRLPSSDRDVACFRM